MNETPVQRQLLLCEKIIFEQGTGNPTLINCHSARPVDTVPTEPASFIVYGLLTDGYGAFTMQMRVMRLDTFEDIYQHTEPMLLADRLKPTLYVFRMKNLVFPVAGRYEIDVLANGELLGMTTLSIRSG